MGRIVVIDTETTWTDEVMSIGAVIVDSENYQARALNAGCMINNYAPASFNELVRNNKIFQGAD